MKLQAVLEVLMVLQCTIYVVLSLYEGAGEFQPASSTRCSVQNTLNCLLANVACAEYRIIANHRPRCF